MTGTEGQAFVVEYETKPDKKTGLKIPCGKPGCSGTLANILVAAGKSFAFRAGGRNVRPPRPAMQNPGRVLAGEAMRAMPGAAEDLNDVPRGRNLRTAILAPAGYRLDERTGVHRLTKYAKKRVAGGREPKYRKTYRKPLYNEETGAQSEYCQIARPAITDFPARIKCPVCDAISVITEQSILTRHGR